MSRPGQLMENLIEQVASLTAEVRVLRDCLDEERVAFEWASRNLEGCQLGDPSPSRDDLPLPSIGLQVGARVQFDYDGQERFSKIVAVDDLANEACIQLIPTTETVRMERGKLAQVSGKAEHDVDLVSHCPGELDAKILDKSPAPGQLF